MLRMNQLICRVILLKMKLWNMNNGRRGKCLRKHSCYSVLFGDTSGTLQLHTFFKPWMSAVPVSAEILCVSSDWWRQRKQLKETNSQRSCSLNNPCAPSAARGDSWKCLESKEHEVNSSQVGESDSHFLQTYPEKCNALKMTSNGSEEMSTAIRTWIDESKVSTTSKRPCSMV